MPITEYRVLQIEKEYCEQISKQQEENGEHRLACFYKNAAKGFESRMQKLTLNAASVQRFRYIFDQKGF